jgi:hypothetical protein
MVQPEFQQFDVTTKLSHETEPPPRVGAAVVGGAVVGVEAVGGSEGLTTEGVGEGVTGVGEGGVVGRPFPPEPIEISAQFQNSSGYES